MVSSVENHNVWISNLTEKHLKKIKQSTISDHPLQCDCTINFHEFNILAADPNKFKLLLSMYKYINKM